MRAIELNKKGVLTKDIYTSRAKIYNFLFSLIGHKYAISYFIDNIPLDKGKPLKVLDAGCGTGPYSLEILNKFSNAEVTAFDLNHQMLNIFKDNLYKSNIKNKVEIFHADLTEPISRLNEQFDLIITGGVLEYVNMNKAIKNLEKYLSKNGLFLNVAVSDNILGQIVGKAWKFIPKSQKENVNVFTNNNFKLLKTLSFPLTKKAYLFKKIS